MKLRRLGQYNDDNNDRKQLINVRFGSFVTALVLFHTSSDLRCDNVPPALDGSVVKRLPAPPPLLLSSLLVNQLKPSTAAPLPDGC